MDIKQTLQTQLQQVEREINSSGYSERRAMLQVAKANILLALQKYEK